jgi:hypothetical protein
VSLLDGILQKERKVSRGVKTTERENIPLGMGCWASAISDRFQGVGGVTVVGLVKIHTIPTVAERRERYTLVEQPRKHTSLGMSNRT